MSGLYEQWVVTTPVSSLLIERLLLSELNDNRGKDECGSIAVLHSTLNTLNCRHLQLIIWNNEFLSIRLIRLGCYSPVSTSQLLFNVTMARITRPRPCTTDSAGSTNADAGTKEPEYTKHLSVQDFFNEKRHHLIESTPPKYSFHKRVVRSTRGELIWPPPSGRPRAMLTEEAVKENQRRSSGKRNKNTAQFCLWRYQALSMWNFSFTTWRQVHEANKVRRKMLRLVRMFKFSGHEHFTSEGARKRKDSEHEQTGGDGEIRSKKQKADDAEDDIADTLEAHSPRGSNTLSPEE